MFAIRVKRLTWLSAAAIAVAGAANARAGNTWSGGGSSGNWSDNNNWGGSAPGYGTLTFTGSTQTTNTDDSISAMNSVFVNGSSNWTLNQGGSTVLALYDDGGAQAKIENDGTGLLTMNLPVTFAANNGSPPYPFGEINAVDGNITFGSGALTVNGSSVNGIKFYGSNNTVTFNDTVSASSKWFAMTAGSDTVAIGGSFTSGDLYVMNNGVLNLNSGSSVSTTAVRLGGDFGTTGSQNLAQGGTLQLTASSGGQTFSGLINAVSGNTSNALKINTQNTSGTDALSGGIYLDSNLTIQNAGALNLTGSTVDVKANMLTFNSSGTVTVTPGIINSTGSGSVVKTGSGKLVLTGAGSYTGGTTISAGTLAANTTGSGNTSTGTGTVIVSGTGTLAGTGTAGAASTGTVVINGGTITAGSGATVNDSTGTLTTASQNWSSGTYVAKVTNTTGSNDMLIMSGLTVASGFNVSLLATNGSSPAFTANNAALTGTSTTPTAGSYIVLASDSESAGTNPFSSQAVLSKLTLNSTGVAKYLSGDSIQLDTLAVSGGYDLIAEDVSAPEPTSFLLLGVVVSPMLLGRRRRTCHANADAMRVA